MILALFLLSTKTILQDGHEIEQSTLKLDGGYFATIDPIQSSDSIRKNVVFTFGKLNKTGKQDFFTDSIYTKLGNMVLEDFNGDGIEDILIQYESDVRSNWTYHLYIVDQKNSIVKKVSDFKVIKNPWLNRDAGIIESYVQSGTPYYQFYYLKSDLTICRYDTVAYVPHEFNSESVRSKTIPVLEYLNCIDK